jgi:SAM-dependent methyltransferase
VDTLGEQFGGIDIYLFDQLLRGRVAPGATVLDAGCGDGRNLVYLLRAGHPVFAADQRPQAVAAVQALAARLAPSLPASNFRCEPVEAMTFADGIADLVISSAVLHFARDHAHFLAMLGGTWRTVRPGGMLFCRLASTIGLGGLAAPLGEGRFRLPDGTDRYLVDEEQLLESTAAMGGELLDPLKTTNVQNQRCMTTWVVRRLPGAGLEKRSAPSRIPPLRGC